jgi:hypothetical protein
LPLLCQCVLSLALELLCHLLDVSDVSAVSRNVVGQRGGSSRHHARSSAVQTRDWGKGIEFFKTFLIGTRSFKKQLDCLIKY